MTIMTASHLASPQQALAASVAQLDRVILGKSEAVRLSVACVLAGGHLLIEDLPGVGKTTLASALARTLGLGFGRVQFTADLLPSDLLGVSVWNADKASFEFHPGPVFNSVLLADEINRATPKTQGALLEAMEEGQVSESGETHPLPKPFFVIATQNPLAFVGTSPLPEAQLDRFLFSVSLGYPSVQAERELLESGGRTDSVRELRAVLNAPLLLQAQAEAAKLYVAPPIFDYLQALAAATRNHPSLEHGLSPRALLACLGAARAWAYLHGRPHVLPEDVQAVFPAVSRHRLASHGAQSGREIAVQILRETPLA